MHDQETQQAVEEYIANQEYYEELANSYGPMVDKMIADNQAYGYVMNTLYILILLALVGAIWAYRRLRKRYGSLRLALIALLTPKTSPPPTATAPSSLRLPPAAVKPALPPPPE